MVQAESKEMTVSFEKSVNNYLDIIIDFQEDTRKMIGLIDSLVESMRIHFIDLSSDNYMEFRDDLKVTVSELLKTYASIRKCQGLYAGAKTVVKELYSSIDNLRETSEDFETFKIDLPNNKEYNTLVNAINAL